MIVALCLQIFMERLKAVKVSTKFRDNSPHRMLVCRVFADQCMYFETVLEDAADAGSLHTFVYSVSMCDCRCLEVACRRCCCVFCLITTGSNYHTATTPPPAAASHGVNHPVNTGIPELQTKVIRGSRRFHNHGEGPY